MNEQFSNETLTAMCVFLFKRSDEAFARAETMRRLLESKDAFSRAEFDALFSQIEGEKWQQTARMLDEKMKQVRSEEQLRFLQSVEGPVQ